MRNIVDSDFQLEKLGLVDLPSEPDFDNITCLAADIAHAPVSLLSFVQHDKDRQYFKSRVGFDIEQTPLSHSFCRIVVESGEALVVDDALMHPVVCRNPAVTDLNVHAYLGFPVTDPFGIAIASLCVIDSERRRWRDRDIKAMEKLALCASNVIRLKWESREFGSMLQKRSNLVDAIAHDITEPVQRIVLIMDSLLNGSKKSSDPSENLLLKIALNSAAKTQGALENLTDYRECFSSTFTTETVDLNRLLNETLNDLRDDILNCDLKIVTGELLTLKGNAHQLAILFRNLVRHALISHVPIKIPTIRIETSSWQKYASISFSYSGAGVILRNWDRHAVQLNSMHSNVHESSGVGMALVQLIVRNHSGSLSVNLHDDNRVAYVIRLPIASQ